MKDKEMHLADLRSLKENISHKIMEAIQDLEARNLRKIEKKIEKASQKIAMGLIKASLKNTKSFTPMVVSTVSTIPRMTPKNRTPNGTDTPKRGRPFGSTKKSSGNLQNKTATNRTPVRGKTSSTVSDSLASNVANQMNTNPGIKKRGRPFGSTSAKKPLKSGTSLKTSNKSGMASGNKSELDSIIIPNKEVIAGKRGRPKSTNAKKVILENRKVAKRGPKPSTKTLDSNVPKDNTSQEEKEL
jgi:hypothetical protein